MRPIGGEFGALRAGSALGIAASLLISCAGARSTVVQDVRVAIRARTGGADQALVILFNARVCSIVIRDPSGQLVDHQADRPAPIDMERAVPDAPWEVQNSGYAADLMTGFAMPPGSYRLVGYSMADTWDTGTSPMGRAQGYTDCPHAHLTRRALDVPFAIQPHQVTLLAVPRGEPTFADLSLVLSCESDPYVRNVIGSWMPAIHEARTAAHAELVARLRQPRDGYDVYPGCERAVAVVRTTGEPFSIIGHLGDPAVVAEFRAHTFSAPSEWGNGFGGGCATGTLAYGVMISNPAVLDAAVRAAGAWLVRGTRKGEVDIRVSPIPVEQ